MNIEALKEELWCDGGILAYARNGNALTQEDMDLLIPFARELNQKILSNTCPVKDLLLMIDTLKHLFTYKATKDDALTICETMMNGVEL